MYYAVGAYLFQVYNSIEQHPVTYGSFVLINSTEILHKSNGSTVNNLVHLFILTLRCLDEPSTLGLLVSYMSCNLLVGRVWKGSQIHM